MKHFLDILAILVLIFVVLMFFGIMLSMFSPLNGVRLFSISFFGMLLACFVYIIFSKEI